MHGIAEAGKVVEVGYYGNPESFECFKTVIQYSSQALVVVQRALNIGSDQFDRKQGVLHRRRMIKTDIGWKR